MMRLLFLCLLLLPAATAVSKEIEGSADEAPDNDDEDFERTEIPKLGAAADKNTGLKEEQTTMIVIIVAAVALALSVAVIVAIVLVKRHKYNRQQGIYSVPTEQDQKGAV